MNTSIPDPERPVEPDDLVPEERVLPDDERPVEPGAADVDEVVPDPERPVPVDPDDEGLE